jgi:hypothetical protein
MLSHMRRLFFAGLLTAACGAEEPVSTLPGDGDAGRSSSSSSGGALDSGAPPPDAAPPPGSRGSISLLTYNVAGLPKIISSVTPDKDNKLISPLLNNYDLVAVQEDWSYHADLISQLTLPSRTPHFGSGTIIDLGDGLADFSKFTLSGLLREKWKDCNGLVNDKNDCGAAKGLLKVTVEIQPGVSFDLYNIHTDAGQAPGDVAARDKQVAQLLAKIASTSANRPIIVAGDTNMKTADEPSVQALITGGNLTDVCRKLSCPEPGGIDRVLYRDSATFKFTAREWRFETNFKDGAGKDLSDHLPVKVVIDWEAK